MKSCYQEKALCLKALSHPVRLAIIEVLSRSECNVKQLQAWLGCHQPYISQHLGILRQAGLVERRRQGTNIYYRAAEVAFIEALFEALALCGSSRASAVNKSTVPFSITKKG